MQPSAECDAFVSSSALGLWSTEIEMYCKADIQIVWNSHALVLCHCATVDQSCRSSQTCGKHRPSLWTFSQAAAAADVVSPGYQTGVEGIRIVRIPRYILIQGCGTDEVIDCIWMR